MLDHSASVCQHPVHADSIPGTIQRGVVLDNTLADNAAAAAAMMPLLVAMLRLLAISSYNSDREGHTRSINQAPS